VTAWDEADASGYFLEHDADDQPGPDDVTSDPWAPCWPGKPIDPPQ
jgi:hypothetical protein